MTPTGSREVLAHAVTLPSRESCVLPPLAVLNRFPDVMLRELDYSYVPGGDPETGDAEQGWLATAVFEVPAPGRGQPPELDRDVVRYALLCRYRDQETYAAIATALEEHARTNPRFKPARITHWRATAVKSLVRSKHGQRMRRELVAAGELPTEAEAK